MTAVGDEDRLNRENISLQERKDELFLNECTIHVSHFSQWISSQRRRSLRSGDDCSAK